MQYKGIPFVFHWTDSEAPAETALGIRASAIAEWHAGNYTGAVIGGLFSSVIRANGDGGGNLNGVCLGGVFGGSDGSLRGVSASGLYNHITEDVRQGVSLSGGASFVGKTLNGVSVASWYNYAGANGRIAVQVGAINSVDNYNADGTVVQVGLYNRAGEQSMPFVNIRGWKNLFKRPSR
jgi:hypothetical protein